MSTGRAIPDPQKILVLGSFSMQNAGDSAILRAVLRVIEAAFPRAQTTVVMHDVGSAAPSRLDLQFVGDTLSWIVEVDKNRSMRVHRLKWVMDLCLIAFSVVVHRLGGRVCILFRDPRKRALLRAYLEADYVLATGGGYLYECRPHGAWFVGIALQLALAIWLDKPLVLLPQSIGPLPGFEQRWLVRWLVQRARLVIVRDEASRALLRNIGARGHILCLPDMAFLLRSASAEEAHSWLSAQGCAWEAGRLYIGLTALNWTAQCATFTAREQEVYESRMAELCDYLIAEKGAQMVCLPQVCGPIAAHDDRLVAQRIRARLRHADGFWLLTQPAEPEVLQAVCGQLGALIGTRMHSLIFALNGGVPVLAVGYLPKSRGLLTWLEGEDWYVDIAAVDAARLREKADQLLAEREARGQQLRQRVAWMQQQAATVPRVLQAAWQEVPGEAS